MTLKESVEYIEHRLEKVALDREPIFSTAALQLIATRAQGVPRVLNIFCDNVLIAGFADQERPISASLAREVIAELEGKSNTKKSIEKPKKKLLRAALVGMLIMVLGSLLYWQFDALLAWQGGEFLRPLQPKNHMPESPEKKDSPASQSSPTKPEVDTSSALQPHSSVAIASTAPELQVVPQPERQESPETAALNAEEAKHESPSNTMAESPSQKFPLTRVVQKGDYLSKMIAEIYGKSSTQRVQWIKMHNPQILDEDQLTVGMVITFPAFDESLDDQ